jgi:thymidylate synthase
MEYIVTPRVNKLEDFLSSDFPIYDQYWREWFYIYEWLKEDIVKIRFTIKDLSGSPNSREFIIDGWYIYDLTARKVTSVEYTSTYPCESKIMG